MQTDDRSRGLLDSEDPPRRRADAGKPIPTDPIGILPYPAAIIDGTGRIELVNEAWTHAAVRGGANPDDVGVGSNYLEVCDAAPGSETASDAGRLLRDVLTGRRTSGSVEYECTAPHGPRRWFFLLASRVPDSEPPLAMVSHVDITAVHLGASGTVDHDDMWRELFGEHPAVVLLIDPDDGRILEVTSLAADFYGYSADALRSMRIAELSMLPAETVRDSLRATLWSPRETRHRFPHRLSSGEVRIVDVYAGPVELDGRQVIKSVIHDVTEQAATQGERELLATAVRHASESVVITDLDANIIYVNPAFERVTGYTREEVIGHNPRFLKSGEQAPAFYRHMWETLTAHRTWSGEMVNRRKDGTLFTEEATITPVFDEDGGLLHFVGVKRDVTRERAERSAKERLAAIVESAADGAYAVSLDGTFLAWNDAAAGIYGFSADQVLGTSVFDLVPDADHDRWHQLLAGVAHGATVGPFDTDHAGRDGRSLVLSVTASPVRNAEGEVTGMATIARDVTGERRLAAERAALEAELRQSQKMEAIGRLAGGMAHDFNNLLTAISGYAAMVAEHLEGPLLDDQKEILRAAERAADLSRRLLAFSRPVPIDPRPVEIDAVLEDAYRMIRRLVPERIEFRMELGSGAHVMADPVELEQLLLNLVVNATDATEGVGRILVETSRQRGPIPGDPASTATSHVLLSVADAGHGMDEETRSRIFEPFFTTKSIGEGTGLGLATVYGIVQRCGGTIAVESGPGRGTTFLVRLPLASAAGGLIDIAPAPAAPRGAGHVLVVEDAPMLRELTGRLLRGAGYQVTEIGDPSEVLSRGIADVDVILTDVVMPSMSGPRMLRLLDARLPVVFMSGYPATLLPEDLGSYPNRMFLEKPFDRQALLAAIAAVRAKDRTQVS